MCSMKLMTGGTLGQVPNEDTYNRVGNVAEDIVQAKYGNHAASTSQACSKEFGSDSNCTLRGGSGQWLRQRSF